MANTLCDYLARVVPKSAEDLTAAFLRLPEDKRTWSPMGDARTALDQVAECALLNGSTATLIEDRTWDPDWAMDKYVQEKDDLVAKGWDAVKALLDENTPKAAAAIRSVPESDLGVEVTMPWGPMKLEQIVSYPFWNMCYHE